MSNIAATLTENDTAAILFQNATLKNRKLVEHLEAKNHQSALEYLFNKSNHPPIEVHTPAGVTPITRSRSFCNSIIFLLKIMSMGKYFITIGHSSLRIPSALAERINPKANLLELSEPGLFEICNWPGVKKVYFDLPRWILDVNRSRDNIDPKTNEQYPLQRDIFRTTDFRGNSLYLKGESLTDVEKESLLESYYDSFFTNIDKLIRSNKYDFFIDIHLMNNERSCHKIKGRRVDICIGNLGDPDGEKIHNRPAVTFDPTLARNTKDIFEKQGYSCALNRPFAGGHIMMKYLTKFPCFQIEINKRHLMDSDDGIPIPEKIEKLKMVLEKVFISVHFL